MNHCSTPDDAERWRVDQPAPCVHGQAWIWHQMSRPNPSLHEQRRRLLHALHGWSCWLCGDPFPDFFAPCIEHVIPRSRGGTNDLRNLQLAHATCNSRKANKLRCGFKPPTVWWDPRRGEVHLGESGHPKLHIEGMWRERRAT